MKKIDEGFDEILEVDYELYSLKLFELKKLAKSWYKGINLRKFDEREKETKENNEFRLIKKIGIVCNYFFAYKEEDNYFLLDGFNRLFTEYGKIEKDTKIYLKVIIGKLKDYKLMSIMFNLNLWKLYTEQDYRFDTYNFFDRGLRLFLYIKFGINIYTYKDYNKRKRDKNDFNALDYYFRDETDWAGYFKYSYEEVMKLFMNKNIVNDLKEISKSNDYLKKPFNNYDTFLQGFIMFLSRRRLKGDNSQYKFNTFVEILHKDEKFFEKLKNMSWTDSTRKNVFNFFENLENRNKAE